MAVSLNGIFLIVLGSSSNQDVISAYPKERKFSDGN